MRYPLRAALTLASVFFLSTQSPPALAAACNIIDGKAFGACENVTVRTKPGSYEEVRTWKRISGNSDGATVFEGGRLDLSGIAEVVRIEKGEGIRGQGHDRIPV